MPSADLERTMQELAQSRLANQDLRDSVLVPNPHGASSSCVVLKSTLVMLPMCACACVVGVRAVMRGDHRGRKTVRSHVCLSSRLGAGRRTGEGQGRAPGRVGSREAGQPVRSR
eukprot:7900-Rhodomonas_salina.1